MTTREASECLEGCGRPCVARCRVPARASTRRKSATHRRSGADRLRLPHDPRRRISDRAESAVSTGLLARRRSALREQRRGPGAPACDRGTNWGPHVMRGDERPARLCTSCTAVNRPHNRGDLRKRVTAIYWGQVVAGSDPVSPTQVRLFLLRAADHLGTISKPGTQTSFDLPFCSKRLWFS